MNVRRFLLFVVAFLAVAVASPRIAAAQQLDVIRGQVTGDDDDPIANANVTATSVAGGVNRTVRTDRNGRFTITFPGGEGDYFLTVTSIGYQPKRFEVRRTADQDILVADVQMTRMAMLDTVRAVAERERVNRNDRTPDVSGTEQSASSAAVPADQQGDLNAIAATIPGVTPILDAAGDPAGFSVLGLSADQNSTTLNGANFGSSTLPRDAQVATSLVTAPYDVSRGGFSGAQLNVRSGSGSNFIRRSNSLNFDAPALQWTDPAARALGQQYKNLSLGGSLSGPIVFDKAFYNFAYQLGRRENDLRTLLNTDPTGFEATGVAADSVARLLAIAQAQSIPLTSSATPANRLRDQGSLFGSFNFTPTNSSSGTTYNLVLNGNWNRQTPAGQLTTELPAHSGDRTNWGAGAQLQHTTYLKQILLSETTLSVGGNRNYGDPYTLLPNGSVLVNSSFADGTSGVRTLGFGGSSNLSTSSSGLTTELQNQLSWFSRNNKHRLKLSSELQYDDYHQDQTTNLLGTFGYNSLADLAANRPAFFTRSLLNRIQSAGAVTAALALGDSYRRTNNLQIQYGAPPRRQPVQRGAGVQRGRRAGLRRAQRRHAEQAVPQPAHRLLVDVRHRAADRRVRGRRAQPARRRARRHRRLPEHAEREPRLERRVQHRPRDRGAAAELRRKRRADPRLERLRQRPERHSVAVRRRLARHRVRQQRSQRQPVRQRLPVAAQRALQRQLERPDPEQPPERHLGRHLFGEPESGEQLRSQLPADAELHPSGRGQPARVRAAGQHHPDHRRDRVARLARESAVQSRERAAE